jgi:hypothetical protein
MADRNGIDVSRNSINDSTERTEIRIGRIRVRLFISNPRNNRGRACEQLLTGGVRGGGGGGRGGG